MIQLFEHKKVIMDKYCQYPVVFYLQGGMIFNSSGLHGKKPFTTKFFLISSISETSNCMKLRLLKPSKHCSKQMILVPSETCITIDMKCICGLQFLPCIPVGECEQSPIIIRDCICAPFVILGGYKETVLWKTNLESSFSGSLKLCIEEGFHESLELRVYHQNLDEYRIYPITQKEEFFIFQECKMITMNSYVSSKKVKGLFEIEMAGEIIDEVVPTFLQ
ncbi:hypothetical protein ABES03_18475 [Neobacillus rhizosphaerae]|uniref:hypothetical protein n=1 Tax=Neobacillus rhizosphaerae TaxID=2880965 RepID=UPI003D2C5C90